VHDEAEAEVEDEDELPVAFLHEDLWIF